MSILFGLIVILGVCLILSQWRSAFSVAVQRSSSKQSPILNISVAIEPMLIRILPDSFLNAGIELYRPKLQFLEYPHRLSERQWVVWSFIGAIIGAMILGIVLWSPFWGILGVCLGFIYPYLYILQTYKKKQVKVLNQFPDYLDTVALMLVAGMDFANATQKYVQRSSTSELIKPLTRFLQSLQSGNRMLVACQHLSQDLDIPELKGFFAMLQESIRSGASLAPTIQTQAELLRNRRFDLAEKRAAKAVVQLTLPLMFIFASILTIVLGPLLVQFLGGF